jgi:DNA-binding transcriptional regulator WhiA
MIKRNGREKIIPNKKYAVDESYFEKIDTEDKAYWLGFLYADGYINDKPSEYALEIGLIRSDKDHIELFSKYIKSNYLIKDRIISKKYLKKNGKYCESSHLRIYNKKVVEDLIDKGCTNNKSWTITFPNFLEHNLERHFIRGYFDGDGSICKKGPNQYVVNICGNELFINALKCVLDKFLDYTYICINKNNLNNLLISNNKDCLAFYKFIYEDCNLFLNRKKKTYENINIIEKNKNLKEFEIIDPKGIKYYVDYGLKKFCLEHSLNYRCIKAVSTGYRKHHKGWKVSKTNRVITT